MNQAHNKESTMNKATENTEFTEINRVNKELRLKRPISYKVKNYFINNFLVFKKFKIILCVLCALCGKI